ncbi:hypothetical protein ACLOJK_025114 [Asimina triloba]
MDRESSRGEEGEDEERGRFIADPNSTAQIRRAPFELSKFMARVGRDFSSNKKYLFAICIPLLLIFVYFSVDLTRFFPSVSMVQIRPQGGSDRVRESELQALYLLRNQQSALLMLWNNTLTHSGSNSSNANSSSLLSASASLDDFRPALLDQIQLNRQIQQTLLSSHRTGISSGESTDDSVGPAFGGFGLSTCRKVNQSEGRRTIEWKPKVNRYLFAICLSGQMSNHLICLEKHMFLAALLNRVLVLPSPKFDYHYDRVIDIKHVNECFGRKVLISFEEFAEMRKNHLHINRFICYLAKPPCFIDEDHLKRLKSLGFSGLSMDKLKAAWPEDTKSDEYKKRVVGDILPKFSCDEEVLSIGEMFYANVEEEWLMQPGHWPNNAKKKSCFFPIPQAAECILRVVERANAPVIYLSTDAASSETDLLQSLTMLNGKTIPLVKRPVHTSVEKWDAYLYRNHLGGDDQVEAMLDKTICAMANVFIGSSGSTFTEDIFRLRRDRGSASVCDEYLCRDKQPNFIADLE